MRITHHAVARSKLMKGMALKLKELEGKGKKGKGKKRAAKANGSSTHQASPAHKKARTEGRGRLNENEVGKLALMPNVVDDVQKRVIAGYLTVMGTEVVGAETVHVWTDGSLRTHWLFNPEKNDTKVVHAGGIGVHFPQYPGRDGPLSFPEAAKEANKSFDCEILACLRGIENAPPDCNLHIHTDCAGVITGVRGKGANGNKLMLRLREICKNRSHAILFEWTKGHSTDPNNIEADRLAGMGGRQCLREHLQDNPGYQEGKSRNVRLVFMSKNKKPQAQSSMRWVAGPGGTRLVLADAEAGVSAVVAEMPPGPGSSEQPIVIDGEDEIEYVEISDEENNGDSSIIVDATSPNGAEGTHDEEGGSLEDAGSDMDLQTSDEMEIDIISSTEDEAGDSPYEDTSAGHKRKHA
ncbi:hypothetical protein HDV00_003798 [Rhizophlyctis rosea]|nr:hypothetical protein HDV00_003798 [Rhizophlyctis rosea]